MQIGNEKNNRQRIFVDMDGTLAEWRNIKVEIDTMEEAIPFNTINFVRKQMNKVLYSPDYFLTLKPNENLIKAVAEIAQDGIADVYILSCVLPDKEKISPLDQKIRWLRKYLPEVSEDHWIFVPDQSDKKSFVPLGVKETDVLIDDYTFNLKSWEEVGRGLKFLNDVNATKGTWNGSMISYKEDADTLKKDIIDYALLNKEIKHNVPDKNMDFITDKEFLSL